jgi:hypothetical protein
VKAAASIPGFNARFSQRDMDRSVDVHGMHVPLERCDDPHLPISRAEPRDRSEIPTLLRRVGARSGWSRRRAS